MVELQQQLGALLCQEMKYAVRDYVIDLSSPWHDSGVSMVSNDENTSPNVSYNEGYLRGCGKRRNSDSVELKKAKTSTSSSSTAQQRAIHWRGKICEWLYQVADHFNFTRDIVYITLNYIDRICTASHAEEWLRDKNCFQLLAMAALCLAIKVHGEVDSSSPETEASIMTVILRLGRGQFSSEELKMMEKSALKRLQWLLHPPTPQVFISFFVELFCAGDNIELKDTAIYLVELSVHDYYFVPLKPSVVALAALSTASSILGLSESWLTGVREDLLLRNGYEEPASIDACSARLEILYASCGTQANDDYVDHADEIIGNHSPRSVMN